MRLAAVVPFLDEERHLPALLGSLLTQTRRPDHLVLVDDGSRDRSLTAANAFAEAHPWARVLRRPPRSAVTPDRLADASELRAFAWAAEGLREFDVIAKLDADLRLTPETLASLMSRMEADRKLGIAGAYLSTSRDGGPPVREPSPPYHVRGATKLYRRECLEDIEPLPAILGWDTIDEARARMAGWRTRSFAIPGGDPVQTRPTGAADGILRAHRRWGACAYAYGAHPLWMVLGAAKRSTEHPLAGANFLAGWALAALRARERPEADVRRHLRREQRALLGSALRRLLGV